MSKMLAGNRGNASGFVGMRNLLNLLRTCFCVLMLVSPMVAHAEAAAGDDPCAPPKYRLDVRPDSKGPPTELKLGIRVVDLLEINDVNQTISIDLAIRMQWTDPRLEDWAGCKLSIKSIWYPELVMKNSGRLFNRWPETVSVEAGGKVTQLQRIAGTFSSYHKLADFPFDTQKIVIQVFPLEWSNSKVSLVDDRDFTGLAPLLNISDWDIQDVSAGIGKLDMSALDKPRSTYELTISAERYIGFYFWKVLLPIALIVVMSWCVFWIDPKQFGTQMGLSATSVLTMIAFIFATTNMLPKLGHFTMLDRYIALATVFVFLALLESLSTGFLVSKGKWHTAHRIDLVSRFLFPFSFSLLCYLFFVNAI